MSQPIHPDLVAQLVDPADAHLSAGSNKPVQWRCPEHHEHVWTASPNTRRKSPACPVCLNKLVLEGVNDLATTDPQIAAELTDPQDGRTLHRGSHKKVSWTCPKHPDHIWTTSVVSRTRIGSGCPYCSGRLPVPGTNDLATTHPDLAAQLVDPSRASILSAGSAKKVEWRCQTDPEHTWSAPVRNRSGVGGKKPTGCPHCLGRSGRDYSRRPTLGELNSPILAEAVYPEAAAQLSSGSGRILEWHCHDCAGGHIYTMSVRHRLRGQGCPVRAGIQVLVGENDLGSTHPEIADQLVDQDQRTTLTRGSTTFVQWQCEHGHVWSAPVYARVAGNGCPECSPVGSSYGEQEMLAALRALDPTTQHRVKLTTPAGERVQVDALAGSLAVEFNGVFWHSEAAGRDRTRHAHKLQLVHQAGSSLLTVWEDDWADLQRRTVLVRTMAHRLGRGDRLDDALHAAGITGSADPAVTERIGARSLSPAALSGAQAADFYRQHHVQGAVTLTRSFALLDQDGRPRAVLGLRSAKHNARAHRGDGVWEIQRYASCGTIPGGFSRLLAHAERTLHSEGTALTSWVTLSANESSDGALYAANGFTKDGDVPPTYWYAGGRARGKRAPKEAFQLKRFRTDPELDYQDGWSELEAATANGMYRVWDAGKTRWIKTL